MEFERFGNQYVLKFDRGDEVKSTLIDFCDREDIRGGYFLAFGAFSRVRLEYFDVTSKQYKDRDIDQQVEVVSLLGNIALADGRPMIHMHAAVADEQLQTHSGHIAEGTVRPTLEVFLTRLEGELRREKDPESGLELLSLHPKRGKAAA